MAERMRLAVPILPCQDVAAMIGFYVERLGFRQEWIWRDPEHPESPASDGGVRCGDVQFFFMANAELAEASRGREVMIFTENVDAQYAEHVSRGAPVASPPVDEPWGLREYSVTDPFGHRLRFAESLEPFRARLAAIGQPDEAESAA